MCVCVYVGGRGSPRAQSHQTATQLHRRILLPHGSPSGTAQHGGWHGSGHGNTSAHPPLAGESDSNDCSNARTMTAFGVGGNGGLLVAFPTIVSKRHWTQQSEFWSFGRGQSLKQDG